MSIKPTTRKCVYRYLAVPLTDEDVLKYFNVDLKENEDTDDNIDKYYEKIEKINTDVTEAFPYRDIKFGKYPCHYAEGVENKYYLGVLIDIIEIEHMSDIFIKIVGKDARKGINEFFFSEEILDEERNDISEVLNSYNIEKEPIELIVPDDCHWCT